MYSISFKQVPLFRPVVFLISGILASDYVSLSYDFLFLGVLITGLVSILLYFIQRKFLLSNVYFFSSSNLFFFFLGGLFLCLSNPYLSNSFFAHHIESETLWIAKITSITPKENSDQLVISFHSAINQNKKIDGLHGKAILYTKTDSLVTGDVIQFKAEFQPIEKNNNRNVFNYKRYLRNKNIYHSAYCKSVSVIRNERNFIQNEKNSFYLLY